MSQHVLEALFVVQECVQCVGSKCWTPSIINKAMYNVMHFLVGLLNLGLVSLNLCSFELESLPNL